MADDDLDYQDDDFEEETEDSVEDAEDRKARAQVLAPAAARALNRLKNWPKPPLLPIRF